MQRPLFCVHLNFKWHSCWVSVQIFRKFWLMTKSLLNHTWTRQSEKAAFFNLFLEKQFLSPVSCRQRIVEALPLRAWLWWCDWEACNNIHSSNSESYHEALGFETEGNSDKSLCHLLKVCPPSLSVRRDLYFISFIHEGLLQKWLQHPTLLIDCRIGFGLNVYDEVDIPLLWSEVKSNVRCIIMQRIMPLI